MILCALPNGLPYSRFGFTASRKVGEAVRRNRARRLMREAVRLQLAEILSGWDLVFVARPSITQTKFSEVKAACTQLLRRAHLLRVAADVTHETRHPGADSAIPAGDFPAATT